MKNLVPWIKSNLVWAISLGVAIIALPVALFFSISWNSSIKKSVGDDVSAAVGKLQGVKVDYALPAVVPGQTPWTLGKTEPNEVTTIAVVDHLKRIAAESEQVRDLAVQRNKAGKSVLVDGLFPEPADESARVRLLTELVGLRKAAAEKLLASAGAGGPPTEDKLISLLDSTRDQETRSITGSRAEQKLTAEEQQQITERLTAKRIDYYQRGAASVRFYAEPDAFGAAPATDSRGGGGGGGGAGGGGPGSGRDSGSGASTSATLPTLDQAWQWQLEQWVYEDVVAALVKANSGASGQRRSAAEGPVKRLLSVKVFDPSTDAAAATPVPGADPAAGGAPASGGDGNTEYTKDYTFAHTGRPIRAGIFDVLHVQVELLADSSRLPALINAISTTNFMSVIDLDVESHDTQRDLAQGYFYGPDHVVKVSMRIETVWLRSWVKPLMPKSIRAKLGIPDDPPPAPADGAPPQT